PRSSSRCCIEHENVPGRHVRHSRSVQGQEQLAAVRGDPTSAATPWPCSSMGLATTRDALSCARAMHAQQRPPGPPQRGVIRKLYGYYQFAKDALGTVGERFERYGDVYLVPESPNPLFVFRHPDHLNEILVDRAAAFTKEHGALARMRAWLGEGLLTSD